MSSNGFLSAPELSFRLFGWRANAKSCESAVRMGITAAGTWYVRVPEGVQAVVLLRYSSFWTGRFAVVTLRYPDGKRSRVWARRTAADEQNWRRLRTWFLVG
jgi:hypothetical protein